jgi:hypothetical protein
MVGEKPAWRPETTPLKPNVVKVLKDTVKRQHHKDLFINEDGHWLLQGWM